MASNESSQRKIKIAALGDLHTQPSTAGSFRTVFRNISEKADLLVLAGDLTDRGRRQEAESLVEQLSFCTIPILGVLGNHDYENNKQEEIKKVLAPKIHFLEEEPAVFGEVGFAGVKGFGGGFAPYMLEPFGENTLKHFVYRAFEEALKLETSLAKLTTKKKVVVLHYLPIRQTAVGEPEEIYPFLGSSRLEESINFFHVSAVFHGHAHFGSFEGKTSRGTPVYNAAMSLRKKQNPDQPYLLINL
jgi:Icc-related predicted phosphoesterase